jgi:hypothetical protein
MTTYFGDSSNHVYTSIPMSKLPSSTSNPTILTSPAETSAMEGPEYIDIEPSPTETSPIEGLENINIRPFIGIADMRKAIKARSERLRKGDSEQQYLVFARVRAYDFPKIDAARNSMGQHIRLTHYTDTDLLIVKLPSAKHESAHVNLANKVVAAVTRMGIPDGEFCGLGATLFKVRNSSKEGDSTYKPLSARPRETDWPTIVFECGYSESLNHLRCVVRWWLTKSRGDVKIVIIISIKSNQSTLQIEKWELAPMTGRRPSTRAFPNPNNVPRPLIPTKITEITIISHTPIGTPMPITGAPFTITGAPLVLEFDKLFLRPAVLPETDITFTVQDLSAWATAFWRSVGR